MSDEPNLDDALRRIFDLFSDSGKIPGGDETWRFPLAGPRGLESGFLELAREYVADYIRASAEQFREELEGGKFVTKRGLERVRAFLYLLMWEQLPTGKVCYLIGQTGEAIAAGRVTFSAGELRSLAERYANFLLELESDD